MSSFFHGFLFLSLAEAFFEELNAFGDFEIPKSDLEEDWEYEKECEEGEE